MPQNASWQFPNGLCHYFSPLYCVLWVEAFECSSVLIGTLSMWSLPESDFKHGFLDKLLSFCLTFNVHCFVFGFLVLTGNPRSDSDRVWNG